MKTGAGVAVFAVALAAMFVLLRYFDQKDPGPAPEVPGPDISVSGGGSPAVPSSPEASAGQSESQVGQAMGADGGAAPLSHLEFGDMDARPWVYRDEAERQAAMRAARSSVSTGSRNDVANSAAGRAAAINSTPVTGDGPLGPIATTRVSGLPGPGETRDATGRIGVSAPPTEIAGPPPEQGIQNRDSPGPAQAGRDVDALPGPVRPAADAEAPSPTG